MRESQIRGLQPLEVGVRKVWVLVGSALLSLVCRAQSTAKPGAVQSEQAAVVEKDPGYDLVSIHRAKPEEQGPNINNRENGIAANAATLHDLVSEAYGFSLGPVPDAQMVNLPSWGKTTRFDLQGKVDDADVPRLKALDDADTMLTMVKAMTSQTPTGRMRMLQRVMQDRFAMKLHYEQRVMPVYAMTVAKGGVKMKVAHPKDANDGELNMSNGKLTGANVSLEFLGFVFAPELGRPVVDRTGLKDFYDIQLTWTPNAGMRDPSAGETGPSLFTAMEEDMGIKLVATKAAVWVIVIDHVEMPTEN